MLESGQVCVPSSDHRLLPSNLGGRDSLSLEQIQDGHSFIAVHFQLTRRL